MSDRLLMMRLMGCKFGIKKTIRKYREDPIHADMLTETRHEVTVSGPSGMQFKAIAVHTSPADPLMGDAFTGVSGNFPDNGELVREIIEMIDRNEFKPHELIDRTRDWPQNHIVFVLDTGAPESYPPSGLRVVVCNSFDELTQDMIEFFLNSEGRNDSVANQLIKLHEQSTMVGLKDIVERLARNRKWSVCDQVWGYDYLDQPD